MMAIFNLDDCVKGIKGNSIFNLDDCVKGIEGNAMKATKEEITEAREEQAYWEKVGKILNAELSGWNFFDSAVFHNPYLEIDNRTAKVLLDQHVMIQSLRKKVQLFEDGK